MNTITFSSGSGARAQFLNRDDTNYHQDHFAVAEHKMCWDSGIGHCRQENREAEWQTLNYQSNDDSWSWHDKGSALHSRLPFLGLPRKSCARRANLYAKLDMEDAFMMLSGYFHGG